LLVFDGRAGDQQGDTIPSGLVGKKALIFAKCYRDLDRDRDGRVIYVQGFWITKIVDLSYHRPLPVVPCQCAPAAP
jgi:hypothetical protein